MLTYLLSWQPLLIGLESFVIRAESHGAVVEMIRHFCPNTPCVCPPVVYSMFLVLHLVFRSSPTPPASLAQPLWERKCGFASAGMCVCVCVAVADVYTEIGNSLKALESQFRGLIQTFLEIMFFKESWFNSRFPSETDAAKLLNCSFSFFDTVRRGKVSWHQKLKRSQLAETPLSYVQIKYFCRCKTSLLLLDWLLTL